MPLLLLEVLCPSRGMSGATYLSVMMMVPKISHPQATRGRRKRGLHVQDWNTEILKTMSAHESLYLCTSVRGLLSSGEPGSSVSMVSGYGLHDRAIKVRFPAEAKGFFSLTSVFRPALGLTKPPVHWVPGVLSAELKRGRGVTLTIHPI
jgi:hypothetical protein